MRPPDLTRPPTSSRRRREAVRRWLATPAPGGKHAAQSACAVLGPAHPLSRATDAVTGATRQWVTCAAILAGSIIAQLEGRHWAAILAASSTLTLAALTLLLLTLKQRLSDRAIHMIAEGATRRSQSRPSSATDNDRSLRGVETRPRRLWKPWSGRPQPLPKS